MNLQAIASRDGDILWVSGATARRVHDLPAGRIRCLLREPGEPDVGFPVGPDSRALPVA